MKLETRNTKYKTINTKYVLHAPRFTFQDRKGYVALMSALIISAVIVLIMVSLGEVSFLQRANIAGAHYKEKSRTLSEACASTALLKLVQNSTYPGNETIAVASDTCMIFSIISSSTGRIIPVQGIFRGTYTNVRVTISTSTVSILGWEEVQSF